jgi:hypothetical protein
MERYPVLAQVRTGFLVLAVALAGCSGCTGEPAAPPEPAPPGAAQPEAVSSEPHGQAPPILLTATLVSPIDIALTWTGADPGAASRVVEYATEPAGPYTILRFVPPGQTTFKHPDLMPETTFYYRVRGVYGPASPTVEVTLPPGDIDERGKTDDHSWTEPRTVFRGPVPVVSIRAAGTSPTQAGAPTDLRATVMHANGIRFAWTDHASDEEGYLLEVRPAGQTDYSVAAVLDRDINSYGLIILPGEKKATYRVRAFYYGVPSNVVHLKTGREPRR